MPEFTVEIKGKTMLFTTNDKVFSPSGSDRGTCAMLSCVEFLPEDKVLDLGCGYGIVGILAAKLTSPAQVTMCDISEDALTLARKNAAANGVSESIQILKSDGLAAVTDSDYTKILSNPPYHTDFSVAKNFIEQGFRHLASGGMFYMVTKRRDWYKNKLISVFGGVQIIEKDGYYIFMAQKRSARPKNQTTAAKTQRLSKKLARKKRKS